MRIIQGILLLLFLGAILIFAVQNNTQQVQLSFLRWKSIPTTLPVLSGVLYLLGMVTGWTVVAFVRGSLRKIAERPRTEGHA